MRLLRRLFNRLLNTLAPRGSDERLKEEIEEHLALQTADNMRAGFSPAEARRQAVLKFGSVEAIKEDYRGRRGLLFLETLLRDFGYAFRMLRKNPGFAGIAVASLTLGIGANTATFTLAKAVLFDAMPVSHPDELRLLTWRQDQRSAVRRTLGDFYPDGVTASFSYPVYQHLRQNRSLGDLLAFNVEGGGFDRVTATIDGQAEVIVPELVSGNYFQQLGVATQLGRPIEPADDATPGRGAVVVLSDAFWARRFGRSASAVGETIDLNLVPVTIVGVARAGFGGASHVQISSDVFFPLSMQPVIFPQGDKPGEHHAPGEISLLGNPNRWWVQIMGRIQPGISATSARASLSVSLDQAVQATMIVPPGRTFPALALLPGSRGGLNYVAKDLTQPIFLLLALAGLVLLLACANVANLLLVRASGRRRELSMRLALGASASRLARQVLTESLMFAFLGCSAGLLLGYFTRNLMSRFLSDPWGRAEYTSRFDWRVVAFALAVSLVTGLIFGIVPAWQATHTSVNSSLKDSGASFTHSGGLTAQALAAAQVSLCALLLVGAGLFARTLINLRAVNLGFQPKGLLLFAISPPKQRYPAPKDIGVLHELEQRIGVLPGVDSVTVSGEPLLAESRAGGEFFPDGQPDRGAPKQQASSNMVGQNFFAVMRIPLLAGREFDSSDTATSPKVAVVNQALARKFFAGMNPLGQTFRRNQNDADHYQIIGVSADAKYGWLRAGAEPTFYTLYLQEHSAFNGMTFEVRTKGDPLRSIRVIRPAVRSVDDDLPLIDVRTQTEQIDATMATERIFAAATSGFGVLALVLATIGLYGVMSFTVARRTNEIGVRMTLGAQPRDVLGMVLSRGLLLTAIGLAIGLIGAFALARVLGAVLYGVTSNDPATYAIVALALVAVAIGASYLPARRAAGVDPIVALRHE